MGRILPSAFIHLVVVCNLLYSNKCINIQTRTIKFIGGRQKYPDTLSFYFFVCSDKLYNLNKYINLASKAIQSKAQQAQKKFSLLRL